MGSYLELWNPRENTFLPGLAARQAGYTLETAKQMEGACRSVEQPFSVICLVASGVGKNGLPVSPKPYEVQL